MYGDKESICRNRLTRHPSTRKKSLAQDDAGIHNNAGNRSMLQSAEHIREVIRETLQPISSVDFAVLFGSAAEGKQTSMSDIDVGVCFTREPSLLEIGSLVAMLEAKLQRDVDVIELNELYKRRPVLAYEIAAKGMLAMCREASRFVDFKRNAFLYYLDTKPLRERVNAALTHRIASGHFGKRNYVG